MVAEDDGTGTGSVSEGFEDNNVHKSAVDLCPLVFVDDLAARSKNGNIQLTWIDTGAASNNVYRSTIQGGPYVLIAINSLMTMSSVI